jgi:hypothetical protein
MGGVLSRETKTRSSTRSRLTQEFIERLALDFRQHGEEVITKLREDSPAVYAQVIAKLCPAELLVTQHEDAELADMDLPELKIFMVAEMRRLFGVELKEARKPRALAIESPKT